MDDEKVKAVLAEFMGLKKCRCSGYCISWVDESGKVDDHPEAYLTDYNAIAEVWRRMRNLMPNTHDPLVDPACMYCVACEQLTDACWFGNSPRDHAQALAKAILEARKNDEPDDWEGDNR